MDPGGDVIEDVDTVDCSEPHDLELFTKVDIKGFDDAYPGEEPLATWLFGQCAERFGAYVGSSFVTTDYFILTITPDDELWESGDRNGLCAVYLSDADGNVITATGSARNSRN